MVEWIRPEKVSSVRPEVFSICPLTLTIPPVPTSVTSVPSTDFPLISSTTTLYFGVASLMAGSPSRQKCTRLTAFGEPTLTISLLASASASPSVFCWPRLLFAMRYFMNRMLSWRLGEEYTVRAVATIPMEAPEGLRMAASPMLSIFMSKGAMSQAAVTHSGRLGEFQLRKSFMNTTCSWVMSVGAPWPV